METVTLVLVFRRGDAVFVPPGTFLMNRFVLLINQKSFNINLAAPGLFTNLLVGGKNIFSLKLLNKVSKYS